MNISDRFMFENSLIVKKLLPPGKTFFGSRSTVLLLALWLYRGVSSLTRTAHMMASRPLGIFVVVDVLLVVAPEPIIKLSRDHSSLD